MTETPKQQQGHVPLGKGTAEHSDDVMAASRFSQQLIEQKERELQESIAVNYLRIRDVEKELRELQMQVKLTAEPKKQALEMLRKKIEVQNNKVLAVRRRYDVAKQAYEQVSTELEHEECLKQQLCDELNQLVSTSVSSQLESFEQLKVKLEALHGGAGAMGRASSAPTQYAPPAAAVGAGAQAGKGAQDAQQQQQQQKAAGGSVDAGSQQHDQQLQPPVQAQPPLPVSTSAVVPDNPQAAAFKAAAAAAAAEAQAARSRHVQLPGRTQHAAAAAAVNGVHGLHQGAGLQRAAQQHAASRQPSQHSSQVIRDREGRFAGFD